MQESWTPKRADRWYERAFGRDYIERYAHRDESEAHEAVQSLVAPLALDRVTAVLDLCSGAGRHARHIAKQHPKTVCFDLSAALLSLGADVPLRVRGDMRSLPFADSTFGLVVNFFTAFGYFEDDAENLNVFHEVARVLSPGGWFVFDFLNEATVRKRIGGLGDQREVGPDGRPLRRRVTSAPARVEKLEADSGAVMESVRLFTPAELRRALAAANLATEAEFGAYDRRPFDPATSDRWIALARRRTTNQSETP